MPIKILVVEDSQPDAELVKACLSDGQFQLCFCTTLAGGVEFLSREGADLVLLDLTLPDSIGLDTFLSLYGEHPGTPIIILTGEAGVELGLEAVGAGAQDYLVKGNYAVDLLERCIRYAMERHRLVSELEARRQKEQQEKELEALANMVSATSLQETAPECVEEFIEQYGAILDSALERGQGAKQELSASLQALIDPGRLGALHAQPRDIVQMHTQAIRRKVQGKPIHRANAYIEEGRLLLVELMGYLASYYRSRALSHDELKEG
ncbi:MAG: response regulator [Planctomycetota bacterium]|nr:response regulator [Planctomycetota bacterium]